MRIPLIAALLLSSLLVACNKPANQEAASTSNVSSVSSTPPPVDFTGVWQAENNDVLKSLNDAAIPFKPDAAKLYAANQAAAQQGDFSWDSTAQCKPPGMPRLMTISQPFEIIQDANVVAMTFQYQRLTRFLYLGDLYPTDVDSSDSGESHAHWDGKVLVIDTNKFKVGTVLDSTGIPHGPKLQLTERWQLTAPDTVIDRITIQDDDTFTQPWQSDVVLKKLQGVQVREEVCVEREGIRK